MPRTGLPVSSLVVLHELVNKGPMTPKQICGEVKLSPRTVSLALRRLITDSLCRRTPNLHDMRQPIYSVNIDRMKELQVSFEQKRAMMSIYLKTI